MGLRHPVDLAAWQRWQDGQNRRRAMKGRLLDVMGRRHGGVVHSAGGTPPALLVVLDSASPTSLAALVAPMQHLTHDRIVVLAPTDVSAHLPGEDWQTTAWQEGDPLPDVAAVVAIGHFLPLGAAAAAWALKRGVPHITVQHGLLTPLAPPLAPRTHLLAWSEADADFWRSGRSDVTSRVVGSEILDAAARSGGEPVADDARPIFLGQLHGA